ncbi:sulfotransferase [Alteromonas sediminis]|uniref:Sulfotransferase n=1 Tax=Alteromonas sediminis TaxID=2259342 RepID=A0A3N5Y0L0_9ALTE|nr:sulfotransferase [Alteromonas sediminis]RPJ67002.1 sulfotransferase [Alteromonas sediminis]
MNSPAQQLNLSAQHLDSVLSSQGVANKLKQPVIILSAPRSGSNLLFEQMQKLKGLWSIGGESHIVYASLPHLRFENTHCDSGSLDASHADPKTANLFRASLLYLARNSQGEPFVSLPPERRPEHIKLIEKTPRNAIAVPFIRRVFPDAKFIFLYREAKQNIASIAEAWERGKRTGQFVTYRNLPDFDRDSWCFLLPRRWRTMKGQSIIDIAAFQWLAANQSIVENLSDIPSENLTSVSYQQLTSNPSHTLSRLANFCDIDLPSQLPTSLPLSRTTVSPPNADKWKKYQSHLEAFVEKNQHNLAAIDTFFHRLNINNGMND